MFPVQLAFSALVWAATVCALFRLRGAMLTRMGRVPRGRRAVMALGLLSASVVALGLGMAALAFGGSTPKGLTFGGWVAITLSGAAFVALQTFALVPLMLNATQPVTRDDARSSDKGDASRP